MLESTCEFKHWAASLPRWVMNTRCEFAWHLARSFSVIWEGMPSQSATFPLGVPFPGVFAASGPGLSKKRLMVVLQKRVTHLLVLLLNQLYLGRPSTADELRRPLSKAQMKIVWRLYNFVVACGIRPGPFPMAPGRSSELIAGLDDLEKFLDLKVGGIGGYSSEAASVPLGKIEEKDRSEDAQRYPQLKPFRDLDASRLKISGTGTWPLASYLDSVLYLPYVEPKFLLHGRDVSEMPVPVFIHDQREEYLKLARRWDELGLLRLVASPTTEGQFTKVFNTYKNALMDRQIGDRRIANARECHLVGPSGRLPNGPLLLNMFVPPSFSLRGSVTDRRDFYHQAAVSHSRAQSNATPFAFGMEELCGLRALQIWKEEQSKAKSSTREVVGDRLGLGKQAAEEVLELFPAFGALYQGDHLGVEFALEGHQQLLSSAGLLVPSQRMQNGEEFPFGPVFEGLIIDDYFVVSGQRRGTPKEATEAFVALERARQTYLAHHLPGSPEKDVVAEEFFKAAGAEVDSSEEVLSLGLLTVGGPLEKRLAMSILSLRVAALDAISTKLASRLSGNWTSLLLYRRCLSCVVDGFFSIAPSFDRRQEENYVVPLRRSIAQELAMLAVSVPLMVSDISAEADRSIFATDASLAKGAIVERAVSTEESQALWLGGDKKGGYSKLLNPFRAALRQVGRDEDSSETESEKEVVEEDMGPLRKQPLLKYDFVEVCGGVGRVSEAMSECGFVVAPVIDLSYSSSYNLEDGMLLGWMFHMLREGRLGSAFFQPPCTSFSPAAHPACRSYEVPQGWDRLLPKVWRGNLLAFRCLLMMLYCNLMGIPAGLEEPRLSKMAWLPGWKWLLRRGCSEAVVAGCAFKSIHKKEFRILLNNIPPEDVEQRCRGGHVHVRIEGKYTRESAIYTRELAQHFARAFKRSLERKRREDADLAPQGGIQSVMVNDFLRTGQWRVVRSWYWKDHVHINLLETRAVLSLLEQRLREGVSSRRLNILLDSTVARCALAKGRSSSRALQHLLRKAAVLQIGSNTYPSYSHAPTKLNVADDPTREESLRLPSKFSLMEVIGVAEGRRLHAVKLSGGSANWVRLVVLATSILQTDAAGSSSHAAPSSYLLGPLLSFAIFIAVVLGFCYLPAPQPVLRFPRLCSPRGRMFFVVSPSLGPLVFGLCFLVVGAPMVPDNPAEFVRAERRARIDLPNDRTVLKQTRDNRQKLLMAFQTWLYDEHEVSFSDIVESNPIDPELVCSWLVRYGRELHSSGKSYNKYSETINAVVSQRPLLKRQMTQAWDLAFAWLQDEPHQHHPALPKSILLAMLSVALAWGWPMEACMIAMCWAGVMRIGELLFACREDLVLPADSSPDVKHILIQIKEPKSRGRAARHQSARVDPSDIVLLVSTVYRDFSPKDRLWNQSAATLRRRFCQLLSELKLPTTHGPWGRPYDLGSLRPGGASWLLAETENTELIRRRGRWQSHRTLEIYLQDIQVATALHKLDESVREKINGLSRAFPKILKQAIFNLECKIPCNAWYFLFQHASETV